MAVPATVATAAKPALVYLIGLGSVRAFFTVGIRSQVDGKRVVTSRLSEEERVVLNGQYALLDPRMAVNEPPASAIAKQSHPS